MTEDFYEQLMDHEGFRSAAYRDSEGYLTIGYGVLVDERINGGITEREARYLMQNRVHETRLLVNMNWPWTEHLDQIRYEVIINMAYNLGVSRFATFKKMLAALKVNDFKTAADEMLDSKWARQVGVRAKDLAEQMRTGER